MKTKILLLSFLVLLFLSQSCMRSRPNEMVLSDENKQIITNEILDLTNNWADSHINMDADKAIELWYNSDSLMFAENGAFFPDRDSIYNYLKTFYSQTKSMNVQWEKRVIVPLSWNTASLSGNFKFKAVFNSNDVFEENSMFTGIFIKQRNKWVLLHGQESFKE